MLGPLARDGKTLWALQTQPGALLRLDPGTLLPTAAPLELPPGRTSGWRSVPDTIWVTAADAGEVLRIDPAAGTITQLRVGGFPIGIVVAGGDVWFADRERGTVTRIDPRTLRPIGDPIQVGTEPSSLVVAGGYLFVGRAGFGTVTRIDVRIGEARSGFRFASRSRPGAPRRSRSRRSGTSVWVSSFASNTLTRISSTAGGAPAPAATVSKALLQIPARAPSLAVPGSPPRSGAAVLPPGNGGLAIGEGAVWALNPSSPGCCGSIPKRTRS